MAVIIVTGQGVNLVHQDCKAVERCTDSWHYRANLLHQDLHLCNPINDCTGVRLECFTWCTIKKSNMQTQVLIDVHLGALPALKFVGSQRCLTEMRSLNQSGDQWVISLNGSLCLKSLNSTTHAVMMWLSAWSKYRFPLSSLIQIQC